MKELPINSIIKIENSYGVIKLYSDFVSDEYLSYKGSKIVCEQCCLRYAGCKGLECKDRSDGLLTVVRPINSIGVNTLSASRLSIGDIVVLEYSSGSFLDIVEVIKNVGCKKCGQKKQLICNLCIDREDISIIDRKVDYYINNINGKLRLGLTMDIITESLCNKDVCPYYNSYCSIDNPSCLTKIINSYT